MRADLHCRFTDEQRAASDPITKESRRLYVVSMQGTIRSTGPWTWKGKSSPRYQHFRRVRWRRRGSAWDGLKSVCWVDVSDLQRCQVQRYFLTALSYYTRHKSVLCRGICSLRFVHAWYVGEWRPCPRCIFSTNADEEVTGT